MAVRMKHIYIIVYETYDKMSYETYYRVINRIKDLTGDWQHPINNVWFVRSDEEKDIKEMLGNLHEAAGEKDQIFIMEVGKELGKDYVGYMPNAMWRWLRGK